MAEQVVPPSVIILGLKVYEYYTPICLTDPREERMVFYTNYISSTFVSHLGQGRVYLYTLEAIYNNQEGNAHIWLQS